MERRNLLLTGKSIGHEKEENGETDESSKVWQENTYDCRKVSSFMEV